MSVTARLQIATVLLLLTASGGIAMAVRQLAGKKNPPDGLAMAHGFLAAAAVTLIVYVAFRDGLPGTAMLGIVLLLAGAVGGVVMNLGYHLRASSFVSG